MRNIKQSEKSDLVNFDKPKPALQAFRENERNDAIFGTIL